ncbi:MAG: class I SAM-dependent methyltransferase [Nitrosomonas sp.]|nr:class I SAM-dependent methyltransferase [Nitrosomonas sp.]
MKKQRDFIPALHYHWLTRWYDPVMRSIFPESGITDQLIKQANIRSGQDILDVGCGTATHSIRVKQAQPGAIVHGLDIDPRVLQIARQKIEQNNIELQLKQGSAIALPYSDHSFDHVIGSLLLHHLTMLAKQQMLREAFRVLKPGGQLHLVDFGQPQGISMWMISLIIRWFEEIDGHIHGLLPELIQGAGFNLMPHSLHFRTLGGTITLWHAYKSTAAC